jgi:fibronectin type 3 domain-containing protein
MPAHLEISWAISPETDIAGYNVYRSEQDGVPGTRLNSDLLLTPAFRDMNAGPGRHYVYTATAVDRAGNESQASAPASGSVPVEGQPANP